ncbi:MAG TPA: hypothetical protein VI685_21315 [Candidatus Angelobacter sp.]
MAKRVLLAGILGGILMFLWGGLWHDQLPTGLAGLRSLPSEQAVVNVLKANVPEPGMYLFPGFGVPDDAPFAQKKAAMQNLEKNPTKGPEGVLIYSPVGIALSAKMLVTEATTNIIQALLVAFLLAQTGLKRFSSRLGFAFVLGLVAALTTNISLWNFYQFPTAWIVGQISFLIIGYFLVGIVVAAIVKTGAPKAAGAAA